MFKRMLKLAVLCVPALLVGCATPVTPYNYSAFEASNPHSILVLPPINNSPDVKATNSVYAQITRPLAESGYYVFPVAVVNETFKQNGLSTPTDIQSVDPHKLRQIFGADAGLYVTITQYGSTYNIISSVVTVAAEARLVDLKTGTLLWAHKVTVVDNGDQGGGGGGGLLGALVKVAVKQIMNSALDKSYLVARVANERLLGAAQVNGLLYGPRSPNYKGRSRAIPAAEPDDMTASTATLVSMPVAQPSTAAVSPQAPRVEPVAPPAMPQKPATIKVAVAPAPEMPRPAVVMFSPQPEAAPAAPVLSGPEQRYADALRRAQAQYEGLNPASNWYRSDLYEWVMDRKAEFIASGNAPDVALQRAVALISAR